MTLRNVGIGWIVGVVVSVVPLVMLVGPFLAGGVAGYVERGGGRAGIVVGGLVGFTLAVSAVVFAAAVAYINLGVVPFAGYPLSLMAVTVLFEGITIIGFVVMAGVGGGIGGVIDADRVSRNDSADDGVRRDWFDRSTIVIGLGSLIAGGVTFAVVAFAVTAVLDPYIWPSAIVGLPAGVIAGVVVSVFGFQYLSRRSRPGYSSGLGIEN